MGKTIDLELTEVQKAALQKGARYGSTPSYRMRCQAVLLKNEGVTPTRIAAQLGCCRVSVHHWVTRYRAEGIAGLAVKPGRGRPPILTQEDLPHVKEAVQNNRQRAALAMDDIEKATGKRFSAVTLRRTLKKMVLDSNDCDA
jgi:transposase